MRRIAPLLFVDLDVDSNKGLKPLVCFYSALRSSPNQEKF
jgi:hypothetical protein